MKRTLTGLVAASIVIGTTIPMASAATTSLSQWFKMTIQVNGQTLSAPYGIAESDGSHITTYIPMYYVNQALAKVGYRVKWDGTTQTWAFTTPRTGVTIPAETVGTGNTQITVNGGLIKKINSIVQPDPADGVKTTYVPIYYVAPLLKAVGISDKWDGTKHVWSIVGNSSTTTGVSTGSSSTGTSTSTPSTGTGSTSKPPSSGVPPVTSNVAAPTIKVDTSSGASNIDVSGAKSGSILTLYNNNGSAMISTSAASDGTAVFYNVVTGNYFVVENVDGQNTNRSNVVSVNSTATAPSTPSIFASESNGRWYIGVNNATTGSAVTLYSTSGSKIASTTANQYGYATFNNVGSGTYYVVDNLNGQNYQSNAVPVDTQKTVSLSTPDVSVVGGNGAQAIEVTNVNPGADVTLYQSDGTAHATVVANSSGDATFNNVPAGTYYAEQNVNGQTSSSSKPISISLALTTPNLFVSTTNGAENLTVSNIKSGATVTLYTSTGAATATTTANSSGYASFNNVATGTYYVVQRWQNESSPDSNRVSVTSGLNQPIVTVSTGSGAKSVTVHNLQDGAEVVLYRSNETVYATSAANGAGYAFFTNVAAGTYYVVQSWQGQNSRASNYFVVS